MRNAFPKAVMLIIYVRWFPSKILLQLKITNVLALPRFTHWHPYEKIQTSLIFLLLRFLMTLTAKPKTSLN